MTGRRALVLGALSIAGAWLVLSLCRAAAVEQLDDPLDTTWMGGPV